MPDRPSSGTGAPDANVPRGSGAPRDPAPSGSEPALDSTAHTAPPGERPPGLREQFGRTREATLGLISAHVKLAKAEFSEIIDQIKRAAMLGSVALGLLFVAATILTVGSVLWLDEWAFGSMGWGVLHGTEFFIALGAIFALLIVGTGGRIAAGGFLALVAAVIVGAIFGLRLTALAFGYAGQELFSGVAINGLDRSVVAGVVLVGAFFAALGLLIGLLVGSGFFGRIRTAIGIAILGAIVGGLFGALLGVPMSWGCAIAVGFAVWLLFWPVFAGLLVFRGLDMEEIKGRFVPDQTIETTKETIEWVRAQTPLGRKS